MGKKVLLISPNFFDYQKIISEGLIEQGYDVDWVDDRPSTTNIVKAISRINRNYISFLMKLYFNKIFKNIEKTSYDIVLLIAGLSFSFKEEMIKKIHDSQPQARFILYQWDSEQNLKYTGSLRKYFDKAYTFDLSDSVEYSDLTFLPLFYSKEYEKVAQSKESDFIYDCSYIGTAHPKKYQIINEISQQLSENYKNQFIYHYMPSKLKFLYHKINDIEFKYAHLKDFKMAKLKVSEIANIIQKSNCVLDSAQENQNGLTMRLIECLGAKKKVITTNTDVKKYDFYKEENIYVFKDSFDFDSVFFKSSYVELDPSLYNKYSLDSWLTVLLK